MLVLGMRIYIKTEEPGHAILASITLQLGPARTPSESEPWSHYTYEARQGYFVLWRIVIKLRKLPQNLGLTGSSHTHRRRVTALLC
jgi:hypothetical protein